MKVFSTVFIILFFISPSFSQDVHVFLGYKHVGSFKENRFVLKEIDVKKIPEIIRELRIYLLSQVDEKKLGSEYYPLEYLLFKLDYYYLQIFVSQDNFYQIDAILPSKETEKEALLEGLLGVSGGGPNYWRINYNLKSEKFEMFQINFVF